MKSEELRIQMQWLCEFLQRSMNCRGGDNKVELLFCEGDPDYWLPSAHMGTLITATNREQASGIICEIRVNKRCIIRQNRVVYDKDQMEYQKIDALQSTLDMAFCYGVLAAKEELEKHDKTPIA